MTKRVLLYFALLLWFVVPVTAQPTIFVEDISVDPGQPFSVDIKASGFIDLLSIQFAVRWDAAALQFDSIVTGDQSAFPDISLANFGTNSASSGKLTTSWFDPALSGVTPADSSTIVTIYYTPLSMGGTSSMVQITDDPPGLEFTNAAGEFLTVELQNGTVTVLEPTSIADLEIQSNRAFTLFQNEPNPFDNQTTIKLEVYEAADFVFEIFDTKGALIYTKNAHYLAGNHLITIQGDILPRTGIYLYKLKTKDYFITNRMILVRK